MKAKINSVIMMVFIVSCGNPNPKNDQSLYSELDKNAVPNSLTNKI
jgi:hypothetical protein